MTHKLQMKKECMICRKLKGASTLTNCCEIRVRGKMEWVQECTDFLHSENSKIKLLTAR